MKSLNYLFVLLIAFSVLSFGEEFKVKSVKGSVKLKNGSNWESVSNGDNLKLSDQVKLDNGASLKIANSKGNETTIDKSGFYSVAKLSAKISTGGKNVSKKLANSLLDEMGEADDMLAKGNVNDNMATLGAVERSFNNKFTSASIVASLPRSSYALENTMKFTWYPMEGAKDYKFVIKNGTDEVLFEKNVSGTEITVDLTAIKLPSDECSYWSVSSGKFASEEFCIFKMSSEQAQNIKGELNSLTAELNLENSMDNMILAKFYANNKIVNEATQYFEKAISIDPSVEAYKVMYAKYLLSIGLNDEAMQVVKK